MGNDWDLAGAAREFARALELDPNLAVTRIYYSWLLVLQGDIASAIAQVRSAQETEPLSPLVNAGAGHTLYLARRYDEAIAACEKSLEIDPNFILGTHVIGMCRALQGRLREAIELGEQAAAMSGRAPFYVGVLGHYHARVGAIDTVRAILTELDAIAATRYVPPHCWTFIHAGLNDPDRAFEWQAKAQEDGASPSTTCRLSSTICRPIHVTSSRCAGWAGRTDDGLTGLKTNLKIDLKIHLKITRSRDVSPDHQLTRSTDSLIYVPLLYRSSCPTSFAGSAPFFGRNFCTRPLKTSDRYKLPS